MFRLKRSISLGYNRQGYIYFLSRCYYDLCPTRRSQILELITAAGGEYADALFEFVTTDATATAICLKNYISRATLYRAVKRYYESFPLELW